MSEKTDGIILLRPHHLQCIKYFVGKGYSDAFTENMKIQIRRLCREDTFILTDGGDCLCRCCPFYDGQECASREKVKRFDSEIMQTLSLSYGVEYSYGTIGKAVAEQDLLNICDDCEWHNLCRGIELRKNKKTE